MYSVCGINAFKSTKSQSFIRLYNLAGTAGRLVVGWMIVLSKSSKSVRYWAMPFGLACTEAGLPGVTGLLYCIGWLHPKVWRMSCSYRCRELLRIFWHELCRGIIGGRYLRQGLNRM